MMWRPSLAPLLLSWAVGCDLTGGRSVQDADDAAALPPDATAPDASSVSEAGAACTGTDRRCEGDTLVVCEGGTTKTTTCEGGCSTSALRCKEITPTGVVSKADVSDPALAPITLAADATLDSDTGAISGVRAAGPGIISGIGFRTDSRTVNIGGAAVTYGVGVFSFASLELGAGRTLTLRGGRAVALVARTTLESDGILDARGTCVTDAPGPGGYAAGVGPGKGGEASGVGTTDPGGGGGGFTALGGRGGPSATGVYAPAGIAYLAPELFDLLGGSGGGKGFNGAKGGGGGGAIQLVAFREVNLGAGGINVGGCGGQMGPNGGGGIGAGGGGGSGGAILIEAPSVTVGATAVLAANGGGGGGAVDQTTIARSHGLLSATAAPGAASGAGAGGAGSSCAGKDGSKPGPAGGGGGGACGRVRINAFHAPAITGVLSPALGSGATATQQAP